MQPQIHAAFTRNCKLNRFYFTTKQRLNNILTYFNNFIGIVILTASVLRIYVTNVKLPDDDIEMPKHVAVYTI